MISRADIVLPPDPWWLLRVPVAKGESTPFQLWILWHYQWFVRTVDA